MVKINLSVSLLLFSMMFAVNCSYAAVSVGDSYGAGTVFCVSQTPDTSKCVTTVSGNYGLIMENVDQANYDSNNDHGVTWSSEYKETSAQSADDGSANTATIIAAHPGDNGANNAAWLCHNYDKEKGRVGFTDWYLPSKNELNKMYIYAKTNDLVGRNCAGKKDNAVRCLLGSDSDQYMLYWSSTEDSGRSSLYAWYQFFDAGYQHGGYKISSHLEARAVRAFNNSTIQQFINGMCTTLYNMLDTIPMDLINIITSYATEVPSREMLRNTECLITKGAS